jgi:hypothetical protein
MIIAANFLEAKKNRYLLPEYPAVYLETHITNLIGDFRDDREPQVPQRSGQALFADYGPGIALTHAHPVDQWQIYLTGKARLTRKPVVPVVIQYTDEWVPYGPIEVEPEGFASSLETYEMPKDLLEFAKTCATNRIATYSIISTCRIPRRPNSAKPI